MGATTMVEAATGVVDHLVYSQGRNPVCNSGHTESVRDIRDMSVPS